MITFYAYCKDCKISFSIEVEYSNWHLLAAVSDLDRKTVPCPNGCGASLHLGDKERLAEEIDSFKYMNAVQVYQACHGLRPSDDPITVANVSELLSSHLDWAEVQEEDNKVYIHSLRAGGKSIHLIAGRHGAQVSRISGGQ
jgi:hypothetical protein